MYCSLIHLYIHPFIHPSVYSFSFFLFFFIWEGVGGREVWGHSKSCLYRRRIRRPGQEERGIYLFLTSSSLFSSPLPFSPFSIVSACQSIPFLFFYVLTFIYKLCLRKQGDYPIISSLKRLAFVPHQLSLLISTNFKSTEISTI